LDLNLVNHREGKDADRNAKSECGFLHCLLLYRNHRKAIPEHPVWTAPTRGFPNIGLTPRA
jgi:hypothetical protein